MIISNSKAIRMFPGNQISMLGFQILAGEIERGCRMTTMNLYYGLHIYNYVVHSIYTLLLKECLQFFMCRK